MTTPYDQIKQRLEELKKTLDRCSNVIPFTEYSEGLRDGYKDCLVQVSAILKDLGDIICDYCNGNGEIYHPTQNTGG